MSTGAIIAIVVIAVIILVLLLVLLPRMRKQAAEKKAERERREHERRLEAERREKADEHRSAAEHKRHQAELAEAEAQRARAEADIDAKRAQLHESGLADDQLPSGTASTNGRTERVVEPDHGHDHHRGDEHRDESGFDSTHLRQDRQFDRDREGGGNWERPQEVRDLGGGGRAHEPIREDAGDRAPQSEYERGLQDGERLPDGGAGEGREPLR